jgi:protein-L-isoaspartate(D-aspartate) O-methyltransferase
MLKIAGVTDPRVEAALAAVPREDYLGKPPWLILQEPIGSGCLSSYEPADLYQDSLVPLDKSKGINNGSPSLHARLLHELAVRPGDRVLHVGAGTGYYTAILAELAGADGRITAVEFDPALAHAARANLAGYAQVTVVQGDGADWPHDEVDAIYVNVGIADLVPAWWERLAPGGRLVFPLVVPRLDAPPPISGTGATLRIIRVPGGFAARRLTGCGFIFAEGRLGGDRAHQADLRAAFARDGVDFIASLRPGPHPPPTRCWFWCPRWSLSFDPPDNS